jgi:aspartyl-tRNA(Asn)/glutamyl-tRNA(Gln) amidotransferase subunit B
VLTDEFVQRQHGALPELPAAKRDRFASQYGLGAADIDQLIVNRTLADRFEAVASSSGDARRAANWMLGPVLAAVNASGGLLLDHAVDPVRLGALITLEAKGDVSNTAARQIFAVMEREPAGPLEIATRDGLLLVSDDSALVAWIDEVFAESPTEAARFIAGERKLQGVLVGQVMKKSKGAADPRKVNQLLAARAE